MGAQFSVRPKRGEGSRHSGWATVACLALAILGCAASLPAASQTNSAPAAAKIDAPANTDNAADELVVATRVVPPFVIEDGAGELSGFSVDLWRAIAKESGLKSRFQVYETLPELLGAVQAGKNPVGIAATSVTADRERVVEFSQPMFRAGLQIMVPAGQSGGANVLRSVFSLGLLEAIGTVLLALLVPAHVAWFIHRCTPKSTWNISRAYWPGIVEAFYWSGEKMIGTASGAPGGAFGRAFNNIWSFLCVMVLASLTALIASALTVSTLESAINGPNDLAGKRVASVRGSTASAYLHELGASVADYPNFADAVAALERSNVRSGQWAPVALVYDAPIVLYFLNYDSDRKFRAVGPPFRAENYGIAFPLDSNIRHVVNTALLKLNENGTYDQINEKWFGKPGERN